MLVLFLFVVGGMSTVSAQVTEDSLFRAPNAEGGDVFGQAVAVDGEYAVVGAPNEDGPSDGLARSGAVYVFEHSADGWDNATVLRAPTAGWGDRFGHAVAVSGDRILVGAYLDDGPSDGVFNAGAAFLFERSSDGTWRHVSTLRASDADGNDRFGYSVALDGDRALVGAWLADAPSKSLARAGAAYVFEQDTAGDWNEEQILQASNVGESDAFGVSVSLDGDRALVGATGEAGPSDSMTDAGAAYLFERDGEGTWQEQRLLRASDAEEGDLFGWSVSLDGEHAVVGVHRYDGPENGRRRVGAAYVFEESGGQWPAQETVRLDPPNPDPVDEFGYAVSVKNGRLLVGAMSDDGPSNDGSNVGAAHLFKHTSQGWFVQDDTPLRASNAGDGDGFGYAVALGNSWAFVGPLSEDGPSDASDQSGAVYAFEQDGVEPARPPVATLDDVSGVEPTAFTLEGTVNPGGAETTVQFGYRETGVSAFQDVTANQNPVVGTQDTSVHVRISGVSAGTEYEVRLAATNSAGADTSITATVVTPPSGPNPAYTRTVLGSSDGDDAGWRMLSQPAAGAVRAALEDDLDFSSRFSPILYRWNGTRWVAQDQASDALPRGEGFILYFFDDASEPLDEEGIMLDVEHGPESMTADASVDGLSQNTAVHLLGNPYETAFDLDSLEEGDLPAAGFQATVQVWNPNAGRYEQIVQGTAGDHIPAWQGFFLERTLVGQGRTTLTFASGGALETPGSLIGSDDTTSSPSLPSEPTLAKASSRSPIELPIQIDVAGVAEQATSTDRATLWLDERADTGYDGYEARDLSPPGGGDYVTVSFPIAHRGRMVQRAQAARPIPTSGSPGQVPLSVRGIGLTGTATLSWPTEERDLLPDEWAVTLVDTHTGAEVDLRTQDYSFELAQSKSLADPGAARFRLEVGPAETLPVELTTFEGASVEQGVQLSWATASETNNAGFRVLRRAPDTDGWEEIGTVGGAGTTSEAQTYRFTDSELPYAADSVSYRLKQMDADGTAHMSKSVAVNMTAERLELLGTYPNPARTQATVRFAVPGDRTGDDVRLQLYDVLGRQVRTVQAGAITGRHEHQLDVSGLSSGMYILQLEAGDQTRTRRMTVVR